MDDLLLIIEELITFDIMLLKIGSRFNPNPKFHLQLGSNSNLLSPFWWDIVYFQFFVHLVVVILTFKALFQHHKKASLFEYEYEDWGCGPSITTLIWGPPLNIKILFLWQISNMRWYIFKLTDVFIHTPKLFQILQIFEWVVTLSVFITLNQILLQFQSCMTVPCFTQEIEPVNYRTFHARLHQSDLHFLRHSLIFKVHFKSPNLPNRFLADEWWQFQLCHWHFVLCYWLFREQRWISLFQ